MTQQYQSDPIGERIKELKGLERERREKQKKIRTEIPDKEKFLGNDEEPFLLKLCKVDSIDKENPEADVIKELANRWYAKNRNRRTIMHKLGDIAYYILPDPEKANRYSKIFLTFLDEVGQLPAQNHRPKTKETRGEFLSGTSLLLEACAWYGCERFFNDVVKSLHKNFGIGILQKNLYMERQVGTYVRGAYQPQQQAAVKRWLENKDPCPARNFGF